MFDVHNWIDFVATNCEPERLAWIGGVMGGLYALAIVTGKTWTATKWVARKFKREPIAVPEPSPLFQAVAEQLNTPEVIYSTDRKRRIGVLQAGGLLVEVGLTVCDEPIDVSRMLSGDRDVMPDLPPAEQVAACRLTRDAIKRWQEKDLAQRRAKSLATVLASAANAKGL